MTTVVWILLIYTSVAVTALVVIVLRAGVIYRREKKMIRDSPLFSAWSGLQTELVKTLHHPHPESQPMDRMLEKLETFTVSGLSEISDIDRRTLTGMLRKVADDPSKSEVERHRAQFLLFAMPQAQREQEAKADASK
jgi:hypothetical protein